MGRKREAQTGGAGYYKDFPTRLRGLLKDTKTTQAALAEHLGIARQSVAAYCSGESTPSWEGIAQIARFFSCSSDYLLGLSEFSSHSLEQITLAELGLNEATIENLEFYCKAVTSFRDKESPKAKDGINLLLGNDFTWGQNLFQEISMLEKLVSGLEKDIDNLIQGELDAIERDVGYYNGELSIREGCRLSPIESLDYRIDQLGDAFKRCVEYSIGYRKLSKALGYRRMGGVVYTEGHDETEE